MIFYVQICGQRCVQRRFSCVYTNFYRLCSSVDRDAFRDAFRASIPIFIAYVPIGLVGGILLNASGVNLFFIFLMSLLVFSGSAQYIAASMIATGAPISSIIITTLIINLRHFLMSSNLNMVIKNKSPKSAQYIAASMIATGAPISSIIITTLIINLRHFLMSSNLNMVIKNKSPK